MARRKRRQVERQLDLIAAIEETYRADDAPDAVWAARVHRAFAPSFDRGLGVIAVLLEADARGAVVWKGATGAAASAMNVETLVARYRARAGAGEPSGVVVLAGRSAPAAEGDLEDDDARTAGTSDACLCIVVTARDHGRLVFFAPSPAAIVLRRGSRARLETLARHIEAAWRLRRSLADEMADEPPVSSTRPRATNPWRDLLREAVKAGTFTEDAAPAPDAEKVMSDPHWSIVEQFESGGRRYIVALEHQDALDDPRCLADREREILVSTARGQSLKVIAYDLGVSVTVVAQARAVAMRKLGLSSYAEVARLFGGHA